MRRGLGVPLLTAALAGAVVMGTAGEAFGQTDEDRAAARTAATDGVTALNEARYQDAIDLFKRAESLIHAPPHLLYMARAQVKLGRFVSAHETYLRVTRETLAPDAPRAFVDAQAAAGAEDAAFASRIPTLKVEVPNAGGDVVTLTIDGVPAPPAVIGLARPIDPGVHKLQATTANAASELTTITVTEGTSPAIALVLKPLASSSAPVDAPPGAETSSSGGGAMRTGAFVAFGVGVVGLATGTLFLLRNHSKRSEADDLCSTTCPASKRSDINALDDSANSAATLAWVGYGVGVAGIGVGTALFLMSDSKGSSAASVRPYVGFGSLGVRGGF